MARVSKSGFTLIELSIVLVIIGLIIGGVIVGKDLISASIVRSQLTQIEQFNTAALTFRSKYNCLPGDCVNAASLGFHASGTQQGQGDGNGVIEGWVGEPCPQCPFSGETALFWEDLSDASLIANKFSTGSADGGEIGGLTYTISSYIPRAKIVSGDYVYIYSGGNYAGTAGYNGGYSDNGMNYFGILNITSMRNFTYAIKPDIPVSLAYAIDQKIDDGSPISGIVLALIANGHWMQWANGPLGYNVGALQFATNGSSISCFDNSLTSDITHSGILNGPQHYSIEVNGGQGANCGLSIKAGF